MKFRHVLWLAVCFLNSGCMGTWGQYNGHSLHNTISDDQYHQQIIDNIIAIDDNELTPPVLFVPGTVTSVTTASISPEVDQNFGPSGKQIFDGFNLGSPQPPVATSQEYDFSPGLLKFAGNIMFQHSAPYTMVQDPGKLMAASYIFRCATHGKKCTEANTYIVSALQYYNTLSCTKNSFSTPDVTQGTAGTPKTTEVTEGTKDGNPSKTTKTTDQQVATATKTDPAKPVCQFSVDNKMLSIIQKIQSLQKVPKTEISYPDIHGADTTIANNFFDTFPKDSSYDPRTFGININQYIDEYLITSDPPLVKPARYSQPSKNAYLEGNFSFCDPGYILEGKKCFKKDSLEKIAMAITLIEWSPPASSAGSQSGAQQGGGGGGKGGNGSGG